MKSAYLHPPKGGFHRVAISSTLVDFIRIADFIAVLRTAKHQFIASLSFLNTYLFILTNPAMPSDRAAQKSLISSSVLYSEKLTRIVESASLSLSPNPTSADEICFECEEQAEPADTQNPFAERKLSIVSLLMDGRVREST